MPPARTPIEPPTLEDFGLTEDTASWSQDILHGVHRRCGEIIVGVGVTACFCFFGFVYTSERNLGQAMVGTMLLGMPLACVAMGAVTLLLILVLPWAFPEYPRAQLLVKKLEEFNATLKAYHQALRRRQADYWLNLSATEFEHEIAGLYARHGYRTSVTGGSGDQGIDIVMYQGDEKIVVQCKRYKNPVVPQVVRELYGALMASDARSATLVCTGGFTKGVYEFARDKPITLLDLDGILELENSAIAGSETRSRPLSSGRPPVVPFGHCSSIEKKPGRRNLPRS